MRSLRLDESLTNILTNQLGCSITTRVQFWKPNHIESPTTENPPPTITSSRPLKTFELGILAIQQNTCDCKHFWWCWNGGKPSWLLWYALVAAAGVQEQGLREAWDEFRCHLSRWGVESICPTMTLLEGSLMTIAHWPLLCRSSNTWWCFRSNFYQLQWKPNPWWEQEMEQYERIWPAYYFTFTEV